MYLPFSSRIQKIERALTHVKKNREIIAHNQRSMSFADGLKMGLEYSIDIAKYCDSDLSVKELTK